MRLALAGNPNSGKTTLYNALTGRNEKTGNWAGVTVEKKERAIKKAYAGAAAVVAVDLPGAYSMSPFTSEESITSAYVREERPDAILNIVDAANLSRSLFFTTQLLALGIPVVIALNKSDLSAEKATKIDTVALSARLHCPVIPTVATTGEGLKAAVAAAIEAAGKPQEAPYLEAAFDPSDRAAVEAADQKRFAFVGEIVRAVEQREVRTSDESRDDRIDAVLTNRWLGIPIFAVVMFLVFQISQVWVGTPIADVLVGWIESFQGWAGGRMEAGSPLLYALVVDGIIGGVGAVVGFLPLVMVLYFLLALLEDCGYLARVAVVLDPVFKKVGLSGKSVIPFVVGVGCAIPGIMACRTIRDERERRATAMLTPFMPCGAKIPVISLFAGAFFENAGWVSALMYFAGIALIFLGALLVNAVAGYRAKQSFFIIEMPEYKAPSLRFAARSMAARGRSYIQKAATIILLCNTVVQIMQTFDWRFTLAASADQSILAAVAAPFAYLLVPVVGVLSWQLAAAAVTGFIAKENVVGTLAVCFGISSLFDLEELAMLEGAGAEVAAAFGLTKIAALAYLMFNLYTPPCFAAIGAMRAELGSAKWLWGAIGLQLGVGYTVAYLVYTIGTLLTNPAALDPRAALAGGMAVLAMAGVVVILARRAREDAPPNLQAA